MRFFVTCVYYELGLVEYEEGYRLQQRLWEEKAAGREDDFLLLLQHPPTLTLGKSGKLDHLLVDREELAREGLSLFFIDRGGDITYHGPGQLVAYPIVDLRRRGKDVHRYVRDLEETAIATLADFSIAAGRDKDHVGVWVGRDKVCAIGVRIRKWVSMHGLALNVNPDLMHFALITPCGIVGRGVTSMEKLLAGAPAFAEVRARFVENFAQVFGATMEKGGDRISPAGGVS